MAWSADSLTFVFFAALPSQGAPDSLQPWLRLFVSPPQSYQQNQAGMPIGNTATGTVGDFQVSIAAQPGRTDLTLLPRPDQQSGGFAASTTPGQLPTIPIQQIDSALGVLIEYASKFIADMSASRIAVAVMLSERVTDKREAVSIFKERTKITYLPSDATDLSFGVNSVSEVSVGDVKVSINRNCRWGTGVQRLFVFQGNAGAPLIATAVDAYGAILVIDINTLPSPTPRPPSELRTLLPVLVEQAKTIISKGYDSLVQPF